MGPSETRTHTTGQSERCFCLFAIVFVPWRFRTKVKSKQASDSLLRPHPTLSLSPQQSTFSVSRGLAAVVQVLRGLTITGIIIVIIRTVYFPSSCCCSGPAWTWLLPPHHHCHHHYHHNRLLSTIIIITMAYFLPSSSSLQSTFYHHHHHNGLLSTIITITTTFLP